MTAQLPPTWTRGPGPTPDPADPALQPGPLGILASLGLRADEDVLCLLSTSGANGEDDLEATLERLHEGASLAGARVWVQCFDTQAWGSLRPLGALVQALRTPGANDVQRVLPGRGGDDLRRALPRILDQHDPLPNGRPVDRLLVVYDGLDSAQTPTVHRGRTIPTVFLIALQAFAGRNDLGMRAQHAQREMPWSTVLPETRLVMALEQQALRDVVAATETASSPDPDGTASASSRSRSRL